MYPKIYYQMKAMAEILQRHRARAPDPAYTDLLIAELESQCEMIECAHLEDDFTGEAEDLADLDTFAEAA